MRYRSRLWPIAIPLSLIVFGSHGCGPSGDEVEPPQPVKSTDVEPEPDEPGPAPAIETREPKQVEPVIDPEPVAVDVPTPVAEEQLGPYFPEWWADAGSVLDGQLVVSILVEHADLREANRRVGDAARDALAEALRDRGVPDAAARAAMFEVRATDAHRLDDGIWRVLVLASVPLTVETE